MDTWTTTIKRNTSGGKLKKTKIDTAYHGVPFLGKVTYPYRGYVNRAAVNDTLKRVLKNNFGITGISTHSLRHTYGTMKNYY